MSKMSVHLPTDVGPLKTKEEVVWFAVRVGAVHCQVSKKFSAPTCSFGGDIALSLLIIDVVLDVSDVVDDVGWISSMWTWWKCKFF